MYWPVSGNLYRLSFVVRNLTTARIRIEVDRSWTVQSDDHSVTDYHLTCTAAEICTAFHSSFSLNRISCCNYARLNEFIQNAAFSWIFEGFIQLRGDGILPIPIPTPVFKEELYAIVSQFFHRVIAERDFVSSLPAAIISLALSALASAIIAVTCSFCSSFSRSSRKSRSPRMTPSEHFRRIWKL